MKPLFYKKIIVSFFYFLLIVFLYSPILPLLVAQVVTPTPSPLLSPSNIQVKPTPADPKYSIPPTPPKSVFKDLLSPGPELKDYDQNSIKKNNSSKQPLFQALLNDKNSFKRRYLEKEWQELNDYDIKPGEKMERESKLFERALSEQFQSVNFNENFGKIPNNESLARRFSIIFFISLPITTLYAFGLVSILNAAIKQPTPNRSTDLLISVSIGSIVSSIIALYDNKSMRENKITDEFSF